MRKIDEMNRESNKKQKLEKQMIEKLKGLASTQNKFRMCSANLDLA